MATFASPEGMKDCFYIPDPYVDLKDVRHHVVPGSIRGCLHGSAVLYIDAVASMGAFRVDMVGRSWRGSYQNARSRQGPFLTGSSSMASSQLSQKTRLSIAANLQPSAGRLHQITS